MARISLGPATGTVAGAQDSKRLVGATPQMSSAGALAGRSINEPALQPQAAPVNTYFQPGAPTLGGPVRVPAPPELPEPSQDLANLAKALGGISSSLGAWGESAVAFQKQRMADAEAAGKATAFSLTQQYPGQDFAALRDTLYKKAQGGDAQAAAMYSKMQALSPLQLAYANRYVAMANLRMDLDAAGDKWAQMTEVPGLNGGTIPKEYLQPNDPRAVAAMQGLLRIPNDPVVWKEFEPLIYAKYSQLSAAQGKVHAQWKEREWIAANSRATTAALQSQNLTVEQKAAYISQTLNDARLVLGVDGYQKVVENVMPQLRASVQLLSTVNDNGVMRTDMTTASRLNQQVSELQGLIVAGPNGERLVDYMAAKGGAVGVVENLRQSMQDTAGMRNDLNAIRDATGEDIAEEYITRYGLNDPALAADQQAYNARVLQMNDAMARDPRLANDPRKLGSAQKRAQSYASTAEQLGSQRVQENFAEQAANIVNREDLTGAQKVALLNQLVTAGADAKTVQGAMRTAQEQRRRDNAPQANANKEMVNRIVKERQAYLTRPGIGGIGLTDEEASEMIQLKADLQSSLTAIEAEVKGKGGSDADVAKAQKAYLDKFTKEQKQYQDIKGAEAKPVVVPNVQQFYQQYNGMFKSVPTAQRRQLNQAVKYGKVVDSSTYKAALEAWSEQNILSPQMRFIINQAGYGNKAGEFFKEQWNNHFPGIPFPSEYDQRLKDLNGQRVSAQPQGGAYSGFGMVNPMAAQQSLISMSSRLFSQPVRAVSPATPQQVAIRTAPAPITAKIGSYAVPMSGVNDTGKGYGVPGQNDANGRPVILAQGAMNSFMQMVRDSKGQVKSTDIASAQRSLTKNRAVGGVPGSPHLGGRAVDIHNKSNEWIRANGRKYGWYYVDYEGTHGGHFEYRGA